MQEFFPHTRSLEQQDEIKKLKTDGKKTGVSMERSKAGTKKRNNDGLSLLNQNTIITDNLPFTL